MTTRTDHGSPAWIRALLSPRWVLLLARLALVFATILSDANHVAGDSRA
ncbi:hypothetical protein LIG30_3137 [Burkholderia sp. lig30]|jgi:hypothetical protein|nr:hypothetical protein [Burkholderia sp. lig30]KDB07615.1 hypothetical protein LIG30_3137 [Burkholderia sp. lig30]